MIIVNTRNGAVSTYETPQIHSVTRKHCAGHSGLFAFGGDTDDGQPIVAQMRLPATLRQSTLKQQIQMVYLSMRGAGKAEFAVYGPQAQVWRYGFDLLPSGQTRCPVGKGIRENYMGFGLTTPNGQAFTLDRIEVMTTSSKTRRV